MTAKMMRFAAALADGQSGADAARTAGYAAASARVTASKLRRDPRVMAELERLRTGAPMAPHRRGLELEPLAFLLSVMSDATESTRTRMRCAIAAMPYVHARPVAGAKASKIEAAKVASAGRFQASAPPNVIKFRKKA